MLRRDGLELGAAVLTIVVPLCLGSRTWLDVIDPYDALKFKKTQVSVNLTFDDDARVWLKSPRCNMPELMWQVMALLENPPEYPFPDDADKIQATVQCGSQSTRMNVSQHDMEEYIDMQLKDKVLDCPVKRLREEVNQVIRISAGSPKSYAYLKERYSQLTMFRDYYSSSMNQLKKSRKHLSDIKKSLHKAGKERGKTKQKNPLEIKPFQVSSRKLVPLEGYIIPKTPLKLIGSFEQLPHETDIQEWLGHQLDSSNFLLVRSHTTRREYFRCHLRHEGSICDDVDDTNKVVERENLPRHVIDLVRAALFKKARRQMKHELKYKPGTDFDAFGKSVRTIQEEVNAVKQKYYQDLSATQKDAFDDLELTAFFASEKVSSACEEEWATLRRNLTDIKAADHQNMIAELSKALSTVTSFESRLAYLLQGEVAKAIKEEKQSIELRIQSIKLELELRDHETAQRDEQQKKRWRALVGMLQDRRATACEVSSVYRDIQAFPQNDWNKDERQDLISKLHPKARWNELKIRCQKLRGTSAHIGVRDLEDVRAELSNFKRCVKNLDKESVEEMKAEGNFVDSRIRDCRKAAEEWKELNKKIEEFLNTDQTGDAKSLRQGIKGLLETHPLELDASSRASMLDLQKQLEDREIDGKWDEAKAAIDTFLEESDWTSTKQKVVVQLGLKLEEKRMSLEKLAVPRRKNAINQLKKLETLLTTTLDNKCWRLKLRGFSWSNMKAALKLQTHYSCQFCYGHLQPKAALKESLNWHPDKNDWVGAGDVMGFLALFKDTTPDKVCKKGQ